MVLTVVHVRKSFIETTKPNELWEVDLIGRLNDNGKTKFIVICVDHHTKCIETKILTQNLVLIIKALEEFMSKCNEKPDRILSDCGLEFAITKVIVWAKDWY
ncbi:reverse transcriptase [Vairimorpha necatrix]|uniref:Reverse transcriptase n=1 Tax=Vairimorpha necatrix TaxID=6039 RepID=A0AAX4JD71_9MICR